MDDSVTAIPAAPRTPPWCGCQRRVGWRIVLSVHRASWVFLPLRTFLPSRGLQTEPYRRLHKLPIRSVHLVWNQFSPDPLRTAKFLRTGFGKSTIVVLSSLGSHFWATRPSAVLVRCQLLEPEQTWSDLTGKKNDLRLIAQWFAWATSKVRLWRCLLPARNADAWADCCRRWRMTGSEHWKDCYSF